MMGVGHICATYMRLVFPYFMLSPQDCSAKLGGDDGKKCYPKEDTPLCLDCNKARK